MRKFLAFKSSRRSWAAFLLCVVLGCADEHEAVRVEGNVVSVTGAPASARRVGPEGERAPFVLLAWLRNLWAATAVAQSSCGAAVEGVLACLATQGAGPTFGGTCARVRSNCEFEVEIGLDAPGDSLFLFFCVDADGNGSCETTERSAPYLNFDKVGNFCNGDVIRVTNVAIDFASQTCTGPPASVVADGCAPPDPTAAPQPTSTRRPDEPEPPSGPSATLPPGVTPSATVPPPPATETPNPTRTPTSPPACVPSGGSCDANADCCLNNLCGDGICQPCAPQGTSCAGDPPLPCCSAAETCQEGVCEPCGQTGDACAFDVECCGQAFCNPSTFTCAPCLLAGESGCSATACCPNQGVCFNDVCQFCSLTEDPCAVSADCCAFGAGVDCDGGSCVACSDFGEFCNTTADCCERPDQGLQCESSVCVVLPG